MTTPDARRGATPPSDPGWLHDQVAKSVESLDSLPPKLRTALEMPTTRRRDPMNIRDEGATHYFGDACPGGHRAANVAGVDWDDQETAGEANERVRAGLAAALVASGYRREADVLRESGSRWLDMAADANWLKTWLSAHGLGLDTGPAGVLAAVGRDFLAYSTKFGPLDPAQPLPVAEGSGIDYGPVNPTDAAAVAYASGGGFLSHEIQFEPVDDDTPTPEGQERSEERERG